MFNEGFQKQHIIRFCCLLNIIRTVFCVSDNAHSGWCVCVCVRCWYVAYCLTMRVLSSSIREEAAPLISATITRLPHRTQKTVLRPSLTRVLLCPRLDTANSVSDVCVSSSCCSVGRSCCRAACSLFGSVRFLTSVAPSLVQRGPPPETS